MTKSRRRRNINRQGSRTHRRAEKHRLTWAAPVHTEKTIKMGRKQAQLEQEWRNPMKREEKHWKKKAKNTEGTLESCNL